MKHTNIKIIVLLLAVLMVKPSILSAQENSTAPAALEQIKSKSLWQQTSNSGGLRLDCPINFTDIAIGYDVYSGNFHRPQEGESGNNLNFGAEGAVFVGNTYAWGSFDYKRATIKDANFNSSIIDPFRGMPYMVADTNSSKWYNQTYDLMFRVTTPKLWNKISLGLEAGYKTMSGAKQRDPRTKNMNYTIVVKPGIVYSINSKHHIGANVEYYNLKEEARPSNVNSYVDQQYYVLYGLGNSISGVGTGRTLNYKGNNVGGGLQYGYQGVINALLSGTYSYKVEDVEVGFDSPRDDASVKDRIWNANLQLYKTAGKLTHFVTMDYLNRKIDGIEYITRYDNVEGFVTYGKDIRSRYETQATTFNYDVTIDKGLEYAWKFGVSARYKNQEDVYLIPRSEKMSENITYQIRAKKNFIFGKSALSRRILLGADYSYNRNISGKYDYSGAHAEYPVVTEFETMDTYYLNSSFYSVGFSAVYSQKIKEAAKTNLYAKMSYQYVKPTASLFTDRGSFQLVLGFNF